MNRIHDQIIPRSFGTHDGTFHADEVTACALLILFDLIDSSKIRRTRDRNLLSTCEYICDVGGVYNSSKKLFDHHQADYKGPFSSAGMVLLHLKEEEVVSSKAYDFFNEALFLGVDAHDNGKEVQIFGYCSYSHVVANFAPIVYDPPSSEQDAAFNHALEFALGHLRRLWQRYQYIQSCRSIVEKAMAKGEQYLFFEKGIPWLELFFELGGENHPALFVIMSSENHWNLRGIPPTYEDRMKVRVPMPKAWAGLFDEELQRVSGVSGAIFCHKERFVSVWRTKEDALKAFEVALEPDVKV